MDDRIDDRRIEMRTITAEVTNVQTWSETSVGSSGGGAFIHPKYGTWVDPVRTWSSTEVVVRARLRFEDGSANSLDFPGTRVRLSTSDALLLMIAEEEVGKRWELAGVANATTGEISYLGRFENVCPMTPQTGAEKFGQQAVKLLVVWVLVMLAIIGNTNSISATGALFNLTAIVAVIILFAMGGGRKAFGRRRSEAEQRYQSLFQRACATALQAARTVAQGSRQAAPATV